VNGVPSSARVRKATIDDHEAVARLNRAVQAWHAEAYPDVFRPASAATLTVAAFEELLAAPDVTTFVALRATDVIGYLTARRVERPETPYTRARLVLYIDQIGVDEAARRTGAGRSLVNAALELTDELGIARVELDTWASNADARAFFDALGFLAHNIRLSLDRPRGAG
jgi:ribosomal protein S18 acetylase RimI-like enzyme